jgi:hypothetical protein
MDMTTLDARWIDAAPHGDDRRISCEPAEGYVLNPWSGLYQETEATYRNRLEPGSTVSA